MLGGVDAVEAELREHAGHHRSPEPPAAQTAPAPSPLARLAGGIGNRSLSQVVARMADGEGILADGAVHPDVTQAISTMSGGGSPLPAALARRLEPTHGDLSDARVHTGPEAAMLSRAVAARAFTVGNDIFFGDGEWQPHTPAGVELAAHEAAHVVQQRGAPNTGSLQVSTPGDPFEREADAASHAVVA